MLNKKVQRSRSNLSTIKVIAANRIETLIEKRQYYKCRFQCRRPVSEKTGLIWNWWNRDKKRIDAREGVQDRRRRDTGKVGEKQPVLHTCIVWRNDRETKSLERNHHHCQGFWQDTRSARCNLVSWGGGCLFIRRTSGRCSLSGLWSAMSVQIYMKWALLV